MSPKIITKAMQSINTKDLKMLQIKNFFRIISIRNQKYSQ